MTVQFKIESGIPLVGARGKTAHYPFAEMRVGDSFRVDKDCCLKVRAAASWAGNRADPKRKYAIRKFDGAYRCWRIA